MASFKYSTSSSATNTVQEQATVLTCVQSPVNKNRMAGVVRLCTAGVRSARATAATATVTSSATAHYPICHRLPTSLTDPQEPQQTTITPSGSDTIPPATTSSSSSIIPTSTTFPAAAALTQSDMTSMMYPAVMFPAPHQHHLQQQQTQFGGAHFFTQMHLASPVAAASYALSTSSSFVPEELRCQYSSKRCENTRTNKKSGGLHKFCAVHREKANRNQMRLDHRRRVLKRMAQREQQRNGGGSRSAPSSVSGSSSPYQKRVKDEDNENDEHSHNSHNGHRRHSSLIKVEDDLEIDLMPLALHRENASLNPQSSTLFDPQDLHILETLLFSDEDQAEDDEDMGEAASSVCHGECCGHSSPVSSTSRSTRAASSPAAVSSWSLNL